MYDLFDTFFNPWYDDSEYSKKAPKQQAAQTTQNLMKTDIKEFADGYELQMDLPGYKKRRDSGSTSQWIPDHQCHKECGRERGRQVSAPRALHRKLPEIILCRRVSASGRYQSRIPGWYSHIVCSKGR